MTRLFKLVAASLLLASVFATTASADAAKGQKYYLKTMKKFTGFNGTKFAAMHTQAEWEKLFADGGAGFIAEFSEKFPDAKDFFNSDNFKEKIMPHIKDFAIMYASDSGNVPSC